MEKIAVKEHTKKNTSKQKLNIQHDCNLYARREIKVSKETGLT